MELTIVILIFLAVGAWKAWNEISNGSGFVCSRLPVSFLDSVNAENARVKKFIFALLLGYIIFAAMILKWIFSIVVKLVDGRLF